MNRSLIAIVTGTALLSACSTELDVTAPYEDHTVVYGLLNMRDSIQYIKINKSFLGDGDAFGYAQIADSNEYGGEAIDRMVVYKVNNGVRVDTFPLHDTIMDIREPGTFHHPQHKVYYFIDPGTYQIGVGLSAFTVHLEESSSYELDLHVKGKQVSAITPITNEFNLFSSLASPNPNSQVNFLLPQGGYANYRVRWYSGHDGKRYVVSYEFHYLEIRGTDTTAKSLVQGIGHRVSSNSGVSGEELEVQIPGEQFYSNIGSLIQADPTVTRRIFTGLDFHFTVANDDFHTFLALSEPVSGIVEDRPAYSNIDGAYGIWGSRYTKSVSKRLMPTSMGELQNGPYTYHLNFCSAFPIDLGYHCD